MNDSTTHSLFDVQMLPVEDVYPDPLQPRQEITRVDELAQSIKTFGLRYPIHVRRDGDTFRIIGGERRWTAFKSLGFATIPAFVATSEEEEIVLLELVDNDSEPLTDIEKSRGIQRAFALEASDESISAATGMKSDEITKARAGYRIARRFYGDEPEPTSLDRIAVLSEFEGDEEAIDRLMKAPEAQWQAVYQDLKRLRRVASDIAKAKENIASAGCELVEEIDRDVYNYLLQTNADGTAPDGATAARVLGIYTNVWISWYGPATKQQVDPEAEAKREAADRAKAEWESGKAAARTSRYAWLRECLSLVIPNSLIAVIGKFITGRFEGYNWVDIDGDSNNDLCEVLGVAEIGELTPFGLPLTIGKLLLVIDDLTLGDGSYYSTASTEEDPLVLAYAEALRTAGYSFSEWEEAEIQKAMAEMGDEDE